jgi:hypothetical protein
MIEPDRLIELAGGYIGRRRTAHEGFSPSRHLGVQMRAEDVFRSVNDRIAEKGSELGLTLPGPFLCECSDMRCLARLELSLEDYAELRRHPGRYLTVPGHEVARAVVVEQTDRLAFAEKLL